MKRRLYTKIVTKCCECPSLEVGLRHWCGKVGNVLSHLDVIPDWCPLEEVSSHDKREAKEVDVWCENCYNRRSNVDCGVCLRTTIREHSIKIPKPVEFEPWRRGDSWG